MKILVLGGTGMLGHAIHRVLHEQGMDVVATARAGPSTEPGLPRALRYERTGDLTDLQELSRALDRCRPDVVVNAAGVIKQDSRAGNVLAMMAANAVLPRRLELLVRARSAKLLHFSTDCVYSGARGMYAETDIPDATDAYGISKFLGEVTSADALTVRTSIIGRGLQPNHSLVDWFLSARGTVKGYRRAVFSGFPVCDIGHIVARMLPMLVRGQLTGLYHLSAAPIDKHVLLELVAARWKKTDVDIRPDDEVRIDRSLDSTRLRAVLGFTPDDWPSMINRMHEFYAERD